MKLIYGERECAWKPTSTVSCFTFNIRKKIFLGSWSDYIEDLGNSKETNEQHHSFCQRKKCLHKAN